MRSPTDSLPCALTDLSIFFLMVKERFPTPFIFWVYSRGMPCQSNLLAYEPLTLSSAEARMTWVIRMKYGPQMLWKHCDRTHRTFDSVLRRFLLVSL